MRTRAVAVASERSNAVGVMELECTPLGLLIVHHGVGSFHDGYAPGAVTTGTRVLIPWDAVRESNLEGDRLYLSVDPALTPHHHLVLAGFSVGDPPNPSEVSRQRLVVRIGTGATMAVAGLLAALTVFRGSPEMGGAAALFVGVLSAGTVLALGVVMEQRLGLGRVDTDGARLAFATELSAFVPSLARSLRPDTPEPLPAEPLPLPSFQALLPRSTTAVVITMSAALLGAVLTAAWVSRTPIRTDDARAETERVAPADRHAAETPAAAPMPPTPAISPPTASALATSPVAPAASGDSATLTGACTCKRSDSLLWRAGIPRMSTVIIDRRPLERHGHTHLEVDLGVVNNWDQPIPEVALLVQFYDRDPPPSTKRTPTYSRPLYFEGPLMPGQAIMWHVEARGDDFDVTLPPGPLLDASGADAAPTNELAELLKAIHRPIRLHGAMMLAFLGDPRAKEATLGLREALREDEGPFLDRLAWTLSDVRTCAVEAAKGGNPRTVRACVFNAGGAARDDLGLKVRALDRLVSADAPLEAPPLVVAEHAFRLAGQLAPGQGALTSIALDTTNADGLMAQSFEAYADRRDVVF